MIGNKLEQSIVEVFQDDLSSTHSINQVSKILKKSYPIINKKSNLFLEEGVLKKINIGKSYQCFLDLNSEKARVLMALNEISRKELFIEKNRNSDILMDELFQLSKKFRIDTVLLYKKSLIFVTPDVDKKDEMMQLSILTKDYTMLFLDKIRFQEYFIDNKDLQKYHVILLNVDLCLNILSGISDRLLISGIIKNDSKKHI